MWTGERLDFGALQQRMVNSAATIRRRLAPKQPASYVAFDLLAVDRFDIRMMRLADRQKRLTSLAKRWQPPLQVSPVTDDPDEAREWLDAFSYSGVEGLVVKGAASRYQPGRREWVKVNSIGVRCVRFAAQRVFCQARTVRSVRPIVRDTRRGRMVVCAAELAGLSSLAVAGVDVHPVLTCRACSCWAARP